MDGNQTQSKFFVNDPSPEEIKNFFLRQKKLADIRFLEKKLSPEKDSSPELSESFEIYLQEKKKKAEIEKSKLAAEEAKSKKRLEPVPQQEVVTATISTISKVKEEDANESICDDSFLEMEKLCENTLTLNNVSAHFSDLTTMEGNISLMFEEIHKKQMSKISEESQSFLHEVEAPSFLMNNTLMSPSANSPFKLKRPSTIMEVSEISTGLSSYRTAETHSAIDKSECYQTACDDDDSKNDEEEMEEKKYDLTSRFKETMNFTKDSLEVTKEPAAEDQTYDDSLNDKENVKQDLDISIFYTTQESIQVKEFLNDSDNNKMNDTLERIEAILANGPQMPLTTPQFKSANVTPKQTPKPWSPSPWSAPKSTNAKATIPHLKSKVLSPRSPMFKFSPAGSPASNFKLPSKPVSSTKTPQPQFAALNNKKFPHIESPISRYINKTPEVLLSAKHHHQYGLPGGNRNINFRDSESFSVDKTMVKGSLPIRAKTTSSKQVHNIQPSSNKKVPGGSKIQNLIASSPSVVKHMKHAPMSSSKMFHDNTLLSETSVCDDDNYGTYSDASFLVAEEIKRIK